MDGSFLSRKEVVEASRRLVCIRLATYEDPAEAALLKGLFRTGSGELENTVFCILQPDGRTKLVRSARAIGDVFSDPSAFVKALLQAADRFPAKRDAAPRALPLVPTVALALNVASADNRPLVVIAERETTARIATEQALSRLAWSPEFIGRFVFARAKAPEELHAIGDGKEAGSVVVVQPDKYGRSGVALSHCPSNSKEEVLAAALRDGAIRFKGERKSFSTHVREGQLNGVFWETQIPVTDPDERGARERGRRIR